MTLISEEVKEKESVSMDPTLEFSDSLEWLHKNTNFPTFAQFKLNPDRWRENQNEIFDCIEDLSVGFKDRVHSVKYFWRGKYECKSLGKVFDIARGEGLKGSDLEMEPIAEPMDGSSNNHDTRIQIQVNVWPKNEFRNRGGIVSND